MDSLVCPLLNLAVYFKSKASTVGGGRLFPEHTTRGISHFLGTFFESEHFPYTPTAGKLGTHSIRKGAVTYASRNGITKEWISQHGRWKGKTQMVDTYIDTYQGYFFNSLAFVSFSTNPSL